MQLTDCERGKRKQGAREGECLLHCKEKLWELSMAGETERQGGREREMRG